MTDGSVKQSQNLETSWAVHIAALTFVLLLPTLATLLYFVVLSGSPWMKGAYFGSKLVQFAFPLVWVLVVQRRKICFARPAIQNIMPGLLVGALIVATGLGAYFGYLKTSPYLQNAPELISLKIADMGLTSPAFAPRVSLSPRHCWTHTSTPRTILRNSTEPDGMRSLISEI